MFIHNKKFRIALLELLFFILSCSLFIGVFYTNLLPSRPDVIFHARRLYDLVDDLKQFRLPMFCKYVGDPMGLATPTMYPYLAILPISILMVCHVHLVLSYVIVESLYTFIGFNCSYYACAKFSKSHKIALLFTIFYILSTISIDNICNNVAMNTYIASLFAPLAFFGFLCWITKGYWKMLVVGLCLVVFNHILSTFLLILLFACLSCVFYKQLNKHKCFNLFKAIIVFLLLSSIIWMPMLALSCSNHLTMTLTAKYFNFADTGELIPRLVDFLIPQRLSCWTYTDLMALIFGLIYWKKLSSFSKKLYISAVVILILMINKNPVFTPASLLSHTFLNKIQFIFRVALGSHLILSYLFALILISLVSKRWYKQNVIAFLMMIFLLIGGSLVLGEFESSYFSGIKTPTLREFNKMPPKRRNKIGMIRLNNKDLSLSLIKKSTILGQGFRYDYAPLESKEYTTKYMPYKDITYHTNNVNIKSKSTRSKALPIILYKGQSYQIYDNNQPMKWTRDHGYLKFKVMNKGNNHIQINTPIMWYRWISYILFIIGIIGLVIIDRRNERSIHTDA